jgi:DNA-binding response OmpR family regulator
VAAVTGRQSEADRGKSAASGIRLHLVKPADPAELVSYLEGLSDAGEQAADGGE